MNSIFVIVAKSIVVYLFILLAIRLFGKKELAQLSVIDLVFILLISNSVQNAMVGSDTSLLGGLAAAGGLFVVNYVLKLLMLKYPRFGKAIQGESILLIYEGKVNEGNLKKAMISMAELETAVREHGVENIKEVNLAILEVDGNISILSQEFKNRTFKKRVAHKFISKNQS